MSSRYKTCSALFAAALALTGVLVTQAPALPLPKNLPPNIVVIIGDDMGWPDFGFHGNDVVQTPTLDMLANRGVLFTSGQLNSSVCTPTHHSFMKGVHHDVPFRVPGMTLPRLVGRNRLAQNDDGTTEPVRSIYTTFQAGKLWNFSPREWGFRKHATEGGESGYPVRQGNSRWGREGWDTAVCGPTGDRSSGCPAMADWRSFLDTKNWKDDKHRFFAVFTPEMPHVPYDYPQVYRDLYAGVDGVVGSQKYHYPMTTWFDDVVWEVIRELRRKQLRRSTLIVFFVDNGLNSKVWLDPFDPDRNRGKGSLYELGMRTPVIFNYANRDGGVVYDDVVSLGDIFHTLIDVTGSERGLRPAQSRSGKSLVPYLVPGSGQIEPRTEFVTRVGAPGHPAHGYVVRTPEWRYVQDIKNGREQLYSILDDPHEEHDLAPTAGDTVLAGFRSSVASWKSETIPAVIQ